MTLTEAAFWTKRLGIVAIGVVFIIAVIVVIAFNPGNAPIPPQYQTASCACTEKREEFLENVLSIPSYNLKDGSTPTYEVQTDTGKLDDNLPDIVNVYRYEDLGEYIDAQDRAKSLATAMGFEEGEIMRKFSSEYTWQDRVSQRSLRVNVGDLNFTFNTNTKKIKSIRAEKDLPSTDEAIVLAKRALNSLSLYLSGYDESRPLVYLIKIEDDGTYVQADSLLSADLIRVDFLRQFPLITIASNIVGAERMVSSLERRNMNAVIEKKNINGETIEIYSFKTYMTHQISNKSNVSVYVGPKNDDVKKLKEIYQIDYKVWDISEDSCGTYPLISASMAEEKIKNGEGSIVHLNYQNDEVSPYSPQEVKKFLITQVALTYYEGLLAQNYLQPVYYFSGEAELADGTRADFDIYYPAINYEIVTDKIVIEEAPVEPSKGLFSL